MTTSRRVLIRASRAVMGAVALGAFVLLSAEASAQPRPSADLEVLGTVLAIQDENALAAEDRELVVDLGADRGGTEGMVVELWRPLKLKHPVTGKLIVDRFRIGSVKLGQVRPTLALASPLGTLTRTPTSGDLVIFRRPKPESAPVSPPSGPPPPPSTLSQAEREVLEVSALFDSLAGASPTERALKYEDYVRANPSGRYSRVLYEEAQSLRKLMAQEPSRRLSSPNEPVPTAVAFQGPSEVVGGMPLRIVIEVSDVATGAVIHLRQAGRQGYVSVPMVSGSFEP